MKNKQSKTDIIDSIYRKNPQHQLKHVREISDLFLEELVNLLKNGISVEIRGLGSFDFSVLMGRNNARNPKTGEKIITTDRCKIRFKPGKEIKEALLKMNAKEFD